MKEALIIFARNEVYGQVKTRIAATAGHEQALSVYQKLLHHTFLVTSELPFQKVIYYADHIEQEDRWPDALYQKKVQQGEDLGARMRHAFDDLFAAGYDRVAIIGTDCLELSADFIRQAFEQLHQYDVVIGPATDGGYYLLAMKCCHTPLFDNIDWSTGQVLAQTLDKCRGLRLSVFRLETLSDIDTEEDWKAALINH